MDIWDGADLALLRETLTQLIEIQGHRSIGVDMSYVKYIPSGFFGMLYDWHERGVAMYLYTPQPNVANMLWFRQFFDDVGDGCFELHREPKEGLMPEDDTCDWDVEAAWEERMQDRSMPVWTRD